MRPIAKRVTVLILMIAGFIPLLFVVLLSVKQQVIRHRMHRRLEEQQLHTVTLPNADIRWAEKGKEIWLDNRLFDIESMEQINGTTVFHGLYDDEETALENIVNDTWNNKFNYQDQLLVKMLQCLGSLYYDSQAPFSFLLKQPATTPCFPAPRLPFWVRTILTPPPQA